MAAAGLTELEGRGVYYFINDKSGLAGKRLMIVGGGDSAFDWAMNLAESATSIVQIHRSDKYRAHEAECRQHAERAHDVMDPHCTPEAPLARRVFTSRLVLHPIIWRKNIHESPLARPPRVLQPAIGASRVC